MNDIVLRLENEHWQAGILPGTGASVAYGRVRRGGEWIDVLSPTAEADYGNPSRSSSFVMLPWCNRIRDGILRFEGREYQLAVTKDDSTARHGDVRGRPFTIQHASPMAALLALDSRTQTDVNWPFAFQTEVAYRVYEQLFVWEIALTNTDDRPMPAGFGHHPYFVRGTPAPVVQIPCESQFELVDAMPVDASVPVKPEADFRQPRPLPDTPLDHLLTVRQGNAPVRLEFPDRDVTLELRADEVFAHWLIYAPEGRPFFAVEPMTNASDGFNLYENNIPGSGVFVLQPEETVRASVTLAVQPEIQI